MLLNVSAQYLSTLELNTGEMAQWLNTHTALVSIGCKVGSQHTLYNSQPPVTPDPQNTILALGSVDTVIACTTPHRDTHMYIGWPRKTHQKCFQTWEIVL